VCYLYVHVERRKLSVLDFRQPPAVCCGARARVWRRIRFRSIRFRSFTADELLLHGTHPLGFTRYTERARIYRVSMLHELGANVPIQSRCGASPATPGAKSQNGQVAGCGGSGALDPFRASLGSHCPLRGS
jgi:hypothetical protein